MVKMRPNLRRIHNEQAVFSFRGPVQQGAVGALVGVSKHRLPYINGEVETTPEMAMDPPEPPKRRETTKHTPYTPAVSTPHLCPIPHLPQPTSAP